MATLAVNDLLLQVDAMVTGSIRSPLTGRPLKSYEATLEVHDEPTKDAVRSALRDATRLTLSVDGVAIPCDRGTWSTSQQEGHPIMTVSVDLTEHEDITPTAVTLGDLTLHPTRYDESLDSNNKPRIRMTVILGGDDTRRLRECLGSNEPFEVTRHGVSDVPLVLRADTALHSLNDDGTTKTRFALCSPSEGSSSPWELVGTLLANIMELVIDERRRSNDLMQMLREKGILSEADVAALVAKNDEDGREIGYALFEVRDADADWLSSEDR